MSEQYPRVTDDFLFSEDGNGVPQWTTRLHFTDLVYKTGTIEDPTNWHFEYIPGMEWREDKPDGTELDYWRIPQSLHRAGGMNIAAGYRKWQAGYRHNELIPVRKGERYLCRAVFKVGIGGTTNPQAIEWMWFVDGLTPAQSQWASYESSGQFGSTTEHLFVFSAAADGWIKTTFWGRSQWRDNTCDMLVSDLMILHVSPNYGGAEIGAVNPFPANEPLPEPDPTPVPVPTPTPTPAPQSSILAWVMVNGVILIILFALFLVMRSSTALASQDVSTLPISLEQAAAMILATIVAIVMGAAQVPVVTPLVNLVKWGAEWIGWNVSADHILLGVSALVTIAIWIAGRLGLGFQLDSVFSILVTVLPLLTQLLNSIFGSKALYADAVRSQVSAFGYQRTS